MFKSSRVTESLGQKHIHGIQSGPIWCTSVSSGYVCRAPRLCVSRIHMRARDTHNHTELRLGAALANESAYSAEGTAITYARRDERTPNKQTNVPDENNNRELCFCLLFFFLLRSRIVEKCFALNGDNVCELCGRQSHCEARNGSIAVFVVHSIQI